LTVDGSGDELLKIKALPGFAFTKEDAARDKVTGVLPEDPAAVAATVAAIEAAFNAAPDEPVACP
jgi:hypothetical protein